MITVIIDQTPIGRQFCVMLMGHAPNPQFRGLVWGSTQSAAEAYQFAQAIFQTASAMTSRERAPCPRMPVRLVVTTEAAKEIRAYTDMMAFVTLPVIDGEGVIKETA